MNVIKELWHGNIAPQDVRNGLASLRASSRNNSPEMKQLMEYMARHHDDLLKSMTDEQKEIFEYAFQLAARLVLDMLDDR